MKVREQLVPIQRMDREAPPAQQKASPDPVALLERLASKRDLLRLLEQGGHGLKSDYLPKVDEAIAELEQFLGISGGIA